MAGDDALGRCDNECYSKFELAEDSNVLTE